jgi:hypothetical protein
MATDIQKVINNDLYSEPQPVVADVKQVIQALDEKAVPLTGPQIRAMNYLEYLQSRPIHQGKRPYDGIIESIKNDTKKTAMPGFFIRVIEAMIPRPIHMDEKGFKAMLKEQQKS